MPTIAPVGYGVAMPDATKSVKMKYPFLNHVPHFVVLTMGVGIIKAFVEKASQLAVDADDEVEWCERINGRLGLIHR